ncbi:TPA: hypothetical protein N0F65_012649 [Lagenidium giganteum]|uniref:AB hydrolase-1 domain-containing protein n=1 Tax=Lagenidium giganteum TaxID=4803 RepID=A0AAV2YNS6_9STRA|nr:TPA: hypothetical protein N0F65_012649 [Lagenidium giganteum]
MLRRAVHAAARCHGPRSTAACAGISAPVRRFLSTEANNQGPRVTKEMLVHEGKEMLSLFVGGIAAVTALLVSGGFAIETGKAYNPPPPPGSLVELQDQDGKTLKIHYQKQGNGPVTVLLDGGVGETSFDWEKVSEQLAQFATVVSIDRPGLGFSTQGQEPRTATLIASEYSALLNKLNLPKNVILVGHGAGGYSMRELAWQLDQCTIGPKCNGLVLVDALEENLRGELESVSEPVKDALAKMDSNGQLVLALAYIGLVRLIGVVQHSQLAAKYSALALPFVEYFSPTPAHRRAALRENEAIAQTEQHFRESAPRSRPLPAVVLSHGRTGMFTSMKFQQGVDEVAIRALETKWQEGQQRLAKTVGAVQIVVPEAGHNIQQEKPEEVVKAVRALIEESNEPGHSAGLASLQTATCPV